MSWPITAPTPGQFAAMGPSLPLICDGFSDHSCLWWPWQFWGVSVRHSEECPSVWILLLFFLTRLRLWVFRRRPERLSAVLITSHQGHMLSARLSNAGANLHRQAEEVFARLLQCQAAFSPGHTLPFGRKSQNAAHNLVMGVKLLFRVGWKSNRSMIWFLMEWSWHDIFKNKTCQMTVHCPAPFMVTL